MTYRTFKQKSEHNNRYPGIADRKYIILGAGGHARVVFSMLVQLGLKISGVVDPGLLAGTSFMGVPVLGSDNRVLDYDPGMIFLANGIGTGDYTSCPKQYPLFLRARVFNEFSERGYIFPPLVHPFAWADPFSRLEQGCQIMAGAVIQPHAHIGENTIINTSACVDHDCLIADHCHIGPGAVLCGSVSLGKSTLAGAGSRILPGISAGQNCIIGAGAVLTRNLQSNVTVFGVPAREVTHGTDRNLSL